MHRPTDRPVAYDALSGILRTRARTHVESRPICVRSLLIAPGGK